MYLCCIKNGARPWPYFFLLTGILLFPLLLNGEETEKDRVEIERLLAKGEQLFKKMYYTSPVGDERNAADIFQKVLCLDPANQKATTYLRHMEDYYIRKVNGQDSLADTTKQKLYYEKILIINPENSTAREFLGLDPLSSIPATKPSTGSGKEQQEGITIPSEHVSPSEQQRLQRYSTYSEAVVNLLNKADELYRQRNSEDQTPARQSIDKFEQALKLDPTNYDALWQISRIILWLGDHVIEDEKIEVFTRGMNYGKKAVELNPNGVEGRYWYGSNIGRFGVANGIFKSLQYISPLVDEMEAILRIDPNHYKALMVLGILYRKAPPWPVSIGDMEKSEQFLKRSLALYPDSLHTHLELGITYNKLKNWEKAKEEFQKVLDMPFEEEFTPENREYKEEAREILMMIKRRGL